MPDILKQVKHVNRQKFDPKNAEHIASLKVFIRTGNWGNVQFFHELPYSDVPSTVMMRYVESKLGVSRESELERSTRLAAMNLIQPDSPVYKRA